MCIYTREYDVCVCACGVCVCVRVCAYMCMMHDEAVS